MRVLAAGGGTGGHVYPVLAVIDALGSALRQANDSLEVLYVGRKGNIEEELVERAGIPFRSVAAGGLRGLTPWTSLVNCAKLARGLGQSMGVVRSFRPDIVFSTGGYVSAPVMAAAWVLRVPTMIYLPDIEPGLAVKALSRLVDRVAVSFEESRSYLPRHKVVVTGYPIRASFFDRHRIEARQRLRLPKDDRTILVLGGSRSSHSLNLAVSTNLERLLGLGFLLHVCGHDDWAWLSEMRDHLPDHLRDRYRLYVYLHEEMPDAMKAADLAVARAGAATMGEFPAAGLPSIMVPYPYSGRHQDPNADFMVGRGVAVKLDDTELQNGLLSTIEALLRDGEELESMQCRAAVMADQSGARSIAYEMCRLRTGDRRRDV